MRLLRQASPSSQNHFSLVTLHGLLVLVGTGVFVTVAVGVGLTYPTDCTFKLEKVTVIAIFSGADSAKTPIVPMPKFTSVAVN